MKEKLVRIEAIPYRSFREKIRITKAALRQKAKVEVYEGYVYTERREAGC